MAGLSAPRGARTVVHYSEAGVFGGAERMLLTLMRGLDPDRWRSVLFHHGGDGIAQLVEESRALGVETRAFPRLSGKRGLLALPSFVAALRAESPVVFHAHLGWALRCTRGILAAAAIRTPAIVASQQLFDVPVRARDRAMHRIVSRAVDRYIAVSASMKRRMGEVVHDAERRIELVRNGTVLEPLLAARRRRNAATISGSSPPVVLALARLDWQKGIEHLVRAAPFVPDARFRIAGEGPDRKALEELAAAHGVDDRVTFLGHRTDVPELLAQADVFVLPSILEGLPVSIVEAMAAGTPVIATDIEGTNEIVRDGVTGLLVPPGDAASLAAAIRRMLSDESLRHAATAEAGALVSAEYGADTMVRRVEQVYDQAISGHRNR
jgi:glycosyltransferase involved in cell wall biosynthesis